MSLFNFKKKEMITSSSELDQFLRSGAASISGISVTPETALKFSPVFTAIRVLAESIGQLPLNLMEENSGKRGKAVEHRLHRILHLAPNSYQTSLEWREMMVAHLCLRGNFYCYINRVRGEVRELLPLQPDAVEPKQDENFDLHYHVKFSNGSEDILSAKEIFHVKLMSLDGIKGLSMIAQARESIGLGMATEKYGSLLFKNGARPGGMLTTESALKSDQVKAIRENWDMVNGGAENAHKTAILQGGLKWTAIGMAAEDAQFLETRKYQQNEIGGLFRVPAHLMGNLERATFSNIEQQGLDFVTHTLMPWIARIEQRVNLSLLSISEQLRYYVKFNVAGLLRGDMAARSAYYSSQIQNGALSPNEIREFEDMNPREGGDIYLTPMNMAINGKPIGKDDEDKK